MHGSATSSILVDATALTCLLFPLEKGRHAVKASAVSSESGLREVLPLDPNMAQWSAKPEAAPWNRESKAGNDGT